MKALPRNLAILAWASIGLAFYAPLLVLRVVEPDDLLDSELVYNRAIGALWRGDPSIAHGFLVGHVPVLALSRLTQPLMALYAAFPPFTAYVINDLIVRAVAAAGACLLLRELEVPPLFRNLAAALFAIGLANTTYGLSIAGLPLAAWLLTRSGWWRAVALLLIGWNSSLYLTGMFFLIVAAPMQRYVVRRPVDRNFLAGLAAYAFGLVLGNAGLLWLALTPHPVWQRAEWGNFAPAYPFPPKSVAQPLFPLFALAVALGWRSREVRCLAAFALFVFGWYAFSQLSWIQAHDPGRFQLDRFYFLWPFALLLVVGLAARTASQTGRKILLAATALGCVAALIPQQHMRQLARMISGRGAGYPPVEAYYHEAWFRSAGIDGPVLSVGIDPMAAPMNGVPSIDGYFPLYPLVYKHAFQRVHDDALIRSWGSKLYATPGSDYCAARALGARYVVSAQPLADPALTSVRGGELQLYRIDRC